MKTNPIYTHRYIARLVLEAETPLFVGSGDASLLVDQLVQKDSNGLPMIPGTALAGVIRHALEDHLALNETSKKQNKDELAFLADIFGNQRTERQHLKGSRFNFSDALMLREHGKVAEGLGCSIKEKVKMFMDNLPKRQHVRLNDRGGSVDHGLFDNEIVYKGIRFVCEISMSGTKEDEAMWQQILNQFQAPSFRIGSGVCNGYGHLSTTVYYQHTFNLCAPTECKAYAAFDAALNSLPIPLDLEKLRISTPEPSKGQALYAQYRLHIKPEGTFMFASGCPDKDVDNIPTEEYTMVYTKEGTIDFEKLTVIPGSSIKGAIAHRLAYHFNRLQGIFAPISLDKEDLENTAINYAERHKGLDVGLDNNAVRQLFGADGGTKTTASGKTVEAHRGQIFIDDIFVHADNNHIFNHVSIDRFTGGGRNGALYAEKASYLNEYIDLSLEYLLPDEDKDAAHYTQALELTLKDICRGLLPLGGMVTKGHGAFTGQLLKNETLLYDYKNEQ